MHTATGTTISRPTDDAKQHCAANKGYDHNDGVNPRRFAQHDRSDNVVDRQAKRDGKSEKESRCPDAALLDCDEAHDRP